jgi:hypothetical protein
VDVSVTVKSITLSADAVRGEVKVATSGIAAGITTTRKQRGRSGQPCFAGARKP